MTMTLSPLAAAPSPDTGRLPRTDEIPDTLANRDVFWFAPDTVIMDAQNSDLIFYGGAPLTGGDAIAFSTLLQASGGGGSVFTLANIIAKSAEASLGEWVKKTKAGSALTPVFFDTWLPFITYQIVRNVDGGVDLVIGNVSDALWNVGGKSAIYDPLKPDAAGYSYQGLMTVKNFDTAFGQDGSKQRDLKGKGLNSEAERNGLDSADVGVLCWQHSMGMSVVPAVNDNHKELRCRNYGATLLNALNLSHPHDGPFLVWGSPTYLTTLTSPTIDGSRHSLTVATMHFIGTC